MEIVSLQEISELDQIKKRLRRFKEYQEIITEKINNCSKDDYVRLQNLKAWVELELLELKSRCEKIYTNALLIHEKQSQASFLFSALHQILQYQLRNLCLHNYALYFVSDRI